MNLRIVGFTLISCLPLILVSACGSPTSQKQSESSQVNSNKASLTPVQVVSDYYKYIEHGKNAAAAQFLTSKLTSAFRSESDSDFNNVQIISGLKVSEAHKIRLNNKYKYEVQVDVNYNAKYRKVITVGNGPQTRFLYLGRNSENDAWRIISIGTGP